MKKNKRVMSIAIEPSLHDAVKEYSKRKGDSTSVYICDLIEKAMRIGVEEEPVIFGQPAGMKVKPLIIQEEEEIMPVVLKIPSNLKGNKEKLTEWLVAQCTALVKKLAGPQKVDG